VIGRASQRTRVDVQIPSHAGDFTEKTGLEFERLQ
jgi:hypothetical protein